MTKDTVHITSTGAKGLLLSTLGNVCKLRVQMSIQGLAHSMIWWSITVQTKWQRLFWTTTPDL